MCLSSVPLGDCHRWPQRRTKLETVKLASCRYLDGLPQTGHEFGQAIRDRGLEAEILDMTRTMGIGAQFGGKYFCHDVG